MLASRRHVISVVIAPDILAAADECAAAYDRSRSWLISEALKKFVSAGGLPRPAEPSAALDSGGRLAGSGAAATPPPLDRRAGPAPMPDALGGGGSSITATLTASLARGRATRAAKAAAANEVRDRVDAQTESYLSNLKGGL
jgi:predicted transcriptional regulator